MSFFLIQNQCLTGRQANFPVFQSSVHLAMGSQGYFFFPNPANMSQVHWVFPLTVRFNSTNEVIFPCLFSVLSTFQVIMGLSSFWI